MKSKNKAVFFDRDGVVNYRMVKDYVKKTGEFHFLPDFIDFFKKVLDAGFMTFLITNQQGVSKGVMSLEQLNEVLNYMQNGLKELLGNGFTDISYCTDLADSGSFYRKPNPGMILEAISKWNIDINASWLIGDSISDVEAGKKAGLKTVLVGSYKENIHKDADFIVKDLFAIEDKVPILI